MKLTPLNKINPQTNKIKPQTVVSRTSFVILASLMFNFVPAKMLNPKMRQKRYG